VRLTDVGAGGAKAIFNGVLYFNAEGGPIYSLNLGPIIEECTALDSLLTGAGTVRWRVRFSEPVTAVDASDFQVDATGVSGAFVAEVAPVGGDHAPVWDVTVNTGTGEGTLGLRVVDNDSILDTMDLALEGLATYVGDFSSPERYTIERTRPTALLSSTAPATIGLEPIPVTVHFSEPVSDFTASGLLAENGTVDAFTGAVEDYSFTLTPLAAGQISVQVATDAAFDAAGNGNLASLPLTRSVVVDEGEGSPEGLPEGEGVPEGAEEGDGTAEGDGSPEGVQEGEGVPEGVEEGEGTAEGDGAPEGLPEGEGVPEGVEEGEGTAEGDGAPEGLPEGEGVPEGVEEGEGTAEGDGAPEGLQEGEGVPEGVEEGDGTAEGDGAPEGLPEGEGVPEGVEEGDGTAEGDGSPEGLPEGEGVPEGVEEGDGIAEGDGSPEGLAEGEGVPEGDGTSEGLPEGEGQPPAVHSADQNGDGAINLTELLRVIELFNLHGLHCATPPASTEDGYAPGPGGDQGCPPHASDYSPQDWQINLTELLRLIQIYNMRGYHACPADGTEDGYCPGAG
jgi:hypothetical protein